MIVLHKLNGTEFTINCDYIEIITENPDTTILLTNGRVYIAKEGMRDIIDKCIKYKKETLRGIISSNFQKENI